MAGKVGAPGFSADFGRTVTDYRGHRAGFPAAFFAALAARELARPGARALDIGTGTGTVDWLPLPGNVVEATEDLIGRHNPAWTMAGGTGIHPRWTTDLAIAGFGSIETFSFDVDQGYSHAAWRGRVRASAGIGASLERHAVERFDAELATLLATRFPADPLHIPHRVWAVVGVRP